MCFAAITLPKIDNMVIIRNVKCSRVVLLILLLYPKSGRHDNLERPLYCIIKTDMRHPQE